ncbi:C4-type zinc ribbon domain-containing protein [Sulfurovum sp.]|uniref:zinc ribbon domain-containing protein n=1 Tax=Sulfurovum sp. TaxID=1969726 RepID=UPI0025FBFDF0|nr:C4-type zinc ribbon domain-containing protein [Sulfurovum sp.]
MNKHLNELIELSKIDQAIDSYNPQLEAADKKVAKVQKKIDAAQAEVDDLASAIASNEEKIIAFEEQLTLLNEQLASNVKKSKEITTEKEMKALSLEEDIAKEKMTFANEEIERLQGINETKRTLLDEAAVKAAVLQDEFDAVMVEVSAEKVEIGKSKESLFIKREELSRDIEQKVLSFYEKIRIWAGNTAVVPVKKQACYGCFMKLNDKTYSEVIRGDEIVNCPHCGRILYIETQTEEA